MPSGRKTVGSDFIGFQIPLTGKLRCGRALAELFYTAARIKHKRVARRAAPTVKREEAPRARFYETREASSTLVRVRFRSTRSRAGRVGDFRRAVGRGRLARGRGRRDGGRFRLARARRRGRSRRDGGGRGR